MLDLEDLADLPTFEFFTVHEKMAEIAILASKGIITELGVQHLANWAKQVRAT